MSHPSSYIEELKDLEKIRNFSDILRVQNFVFSLVPWTEVPFRENLKNIGTEKLYHRFKSKEIGGWCDTNAEFFRLLMVDYGIQTTHSINFGVRKYYLTHSANIVEFDGMRFYIDPYFAKHYTYSDEFPVTYDMLINLIRMKKFNKIIPHYGQVKKLLIKKEGQYYLTPIEFEMCVIASFSVIRYKEIMKMVFGDPHFNNLMLLEIPSIFEEIINRTIQLPIGK